MYIFQSTKDMRFYAVKDIVFNYPGYLDAQQINEIFDDIADCSGCLFDLYCDPDEATIDEKIMWLRKNKYLKLKLVNLLSRQGMMEVWSGGM